ncbi:MAG: hormogonium polysaccharide biosynthesis protein HpsA [Cyanobacteria bacterium P01_H01_bin.162]
MPLDRHNSRKSRPVQPLKRFMQSLFRQLMQLSGRRSAQAGFVFPTTLLLLLMVTLTATALTYRTFSRSEQVIGQREQQVIYNAATPAIDRARAKIEYLFQEDNRLPSGVPPSDRISDMMLPEASRVLLNTDVTPNVPVVADLTIPTGTNADPYTLPDETRVDLNGDGDLDNAWYFNTQQDVDNDGVNDLAIYSIMIDDLGPGDIAPDDAAAIFVTEADEQTKASALVTRTGPLSTTEATPLCAAAAAEGGWQIVTAGNIASLQKNFQVNASVVGSSPTKATTETLEFQQSRIADRANKWGAWFRYDMEIHPGEPFDWNGAMHTDGNLVVNGGVEPHMVSSFNSCVYSQEASEITLGQFDNDGTNGVDITAAAAGTLGDFQGQAITALTRTNGFTAGNVIFHTYDTRTTAPDTFQLNSGTDSVTGSGLPSDVAMNPIILFTQDLESHIDPTTWQRDANWETRDVVTSERIYNDQAARPFVDDFYRADDRWGPKPRYGARDELLDLTDATFRANTQSGDDIKDTGNADYNAIADSNLTNPNDGLDGYWERQAVRTGMRVIMGQRLELGNANGWGYDPTPGGFVSGATEADGDPLYPPKTLKTAFTGNNARTGGDNEQLHRKSLRDNLAAVQGMVVYHYDEVGNGSFPAACMAMTAHPGTPESILASRTFEDYPSAAAPLETDFLAGKGTNGWEFAYNAAFANAANFATQYNSATSDLKKALTNLAFFAGDPSGGAPSFAAVQDGFVHPFPYMAMWGDFSVLRRIIAQGKTYANLSPADQSTLHAAACTLGLLGHNLNTIESEFGAITNWSALATVLLARIDAPTNGVPLADAGTTPPDAWIGLAEAEAVTPADLANVRLMKIAAERWQVLRDRTFGFATGQGLVSGLAPTVGTYTPASGEFVLNAAAPPFVTTGPYSVSCDPNFFAANGAPNADQALTLALALCPKRENLTATNAEKAVKYPSLYYLFPLANHGQKDLTLTTATTLDGYETEEFIDATATTATPTNDLITDYAVNTGATDFQLVDPSTVAGLPRATDFSDWVLPTNAGTALTVSNLDDEPFAVNVGAVPTGRNLSMLDKGMYDGRELLNVRVLDMDLKALIGGTTSGGDFWISDDPTAQAEGVVYAFREDAVREDEIVRPQSTAAGVDAAYCGGVVKAQVPQLFRLEHDAACHMQFGLQDGTNAQDPPLTDELISLKPVDYIPDGERRSYGFRLTTRDGTPADFSGGNPAATDARQDGMTFVTDNSVYIKGDFNPHSSDGTTANLLEEFDETILGGAFAFNDFYQNRQNLNTGTFANLAADHWRPVEVLADSMTILSQSFRDGAISDTVTVADTNTSVKTSYTNQLRPEFTGADAPLPNNWAQENPDDAGSPLWIDRNGSYYVIDGSGNTVPFYVEYNTDGEWIDFDETGINAERRRNLQDATNTFVNSIFVSGIIPRRPQQGYGGLHNYPRLLEDWGGQALSIQGSFLQLNFSTAGVGPQEQEAYDPGAPPTATEHIVYYWPPERRWGYDVGLLYVPPSPAARRFVALSNDRSEYYRELPANDPYINNLICAEEAGGARVFTGGICP